MKSTILITGKISSATVDSFYSNPDFEIIYKPDCQSEEFLSILANVDVVITRSETTIDKKAIDKASRLKIIARAAVGVANDDNAELSLLEYEPNFADDDSSNDLISRLSCQIILEEKHNGLVVIVP